MRDRFELRKVYDEGWDNWDPELLLSTVAPGFTFEDPGYHEPVTAENMAEFMAGWHDRVKAVGGTGEIGSRDRVHQDQDGVLLSWHWWSFVGTKIEGTAVTRTTDEGVQYERMTHHGPTGNMRGSGRKNGLLVSASAPDWTSWTPPGNHTDQSPPRYQVVFADEENKTRGLVQGVLEYPPGARSQAHWHTPVETYYILSGSGIGHIGDETIGFSTGDSVYVPGNVVHWFENPSQQPLSVLWTLNCDAIGDIDFTFID